MLEAQKKLSNSFYGLLSLPSTAMGFALSVQISALCWILTTKYGLDIHEVGLVSTGKLSAAQPEWRSGRFCRNGPQVQRRRSRYLCRYHHQSYDRCVFRDVVFLDNHDNQRHDALSFSDGALYDLANVFMLATPYGRPRVMSSYHFEEPSDGAPSEADGTIRRVHGEGEHSCDDANWVCEHRRPAIAGMAGFRRATAASDSITDWWSKGQDQIAFSRSGLGFVAINRSNAPMSEDLYTSLPPGSYCDVLSRQPADQSCPGERLLVDESGTARVHVPAMSATAFVLEKRIPQPQ